MHTLVKAILPTVMVVSTGLVDAHEEDHRGDPSHSSAESFFQQLPEVFQIHAQESRASLGLILRKSDGGITVQGIPHDSPSASAGVEEGDVIESIDALNLQNENATIDSVIEYLENVEPGTVVQLEINRDGTSKTIEVETEPLNQMNYARQSQRNWGPQIYIDRERIDLPHMRDWMERGRGQFRGRGMRSQMDIDLTPLNEDLAEYFQADEGVLVLETPGESPLRAGDVITAVGDESISDVDELMDALTGEADTATVQRKRKEIEVDVSNILSALGFERDVRLRPMGDDQPNRRQRGPRPYGSSL